MRICLSFFCALFLGMPALVIGDQWVYFGTYTKGESEGIYVAPFDSVSGKIGEGKLAASLENPSFLALHPDGDTLFAVSEVADFEDGGAVYAFSVDPRTGNLELINRQATRGGAPCHLSLDSKGECLLVANYSGGNVVSYRVEETGALSEPVSVIQHEGSSINEKRQKTPHAHSINPGPNGRYAYAADLGADRLFIYRLDAENGKLQASGSGKSKAGSGPRHSAIDSSGKFLYTVNELDLTVTVFTIDADTGGLESIQSVRTMPDGVENVGSTAEIRIHPDGRHLYSSNRGHDSIAVFRIDPKEGTLKQIQVEPIRGEVPRNFNIDKTGKFLLAAGQKSDSVSVFTIDSQTGKLSFSGQTISVPSPVCVKFLERETPDAP